VCRFRHSEHWGCSVEHWTCQITCKSRYILLGSSRVISNGLTYLCDAAATSFACSCAHNTLQAHGRTPPKKGRALAERTEGQVPVHGQWLACQTRVALRSAICNLFLYVVWSSPLGVFFPLAYEPAYFVHNMTSPSRRWVAHTKALIRPRPKCPHLISAFLDSKTTRQSHISRRIETPCTAMLRSSSRHISLVLLLFDQADTVPMRDLSQVVTSVSCTCSSSPR
jgi:hypothetical protein